MNEPRIIYLTTEDSKRLATWLELFDIPPEGVNRGRFGMMQLGTSWISTSELEALSDAFPPFDAVGIVRGSVGISEASMT